MGIRARSILVFVGSRILIYSSIALIIGIILFPPQNKYGIPLSLDVDSDHLIFLELEYLRYLAENAVTKENRNLLVGSDVSVMEAHRFFRKYGALSGDFSEFVYSLSDAATYEDIMFVGIVREDDDLIKNADLIKNTIPKKTLNNNNANLSYLAINTPIILNTYVHSLSRPTEKDLLAGVKIKSCFFGTGSFLMEQGLGIAGRGCVNLSMSARNDYYVGVVLGDFVGDLEGDFGNNNSYYLKAISAMSDRDYFKDLCETPYDGGLFLITKIDLGAE